MAWEHINTIFPIGYIETVQQGILTNKQIVDKKLKMVSAMRSYASRGMFYKQEEWAWGENGEFAVITKFDAMSLTPHVDNINPLNIYGSLMVRQFLDDNGLTVEYQNNNDTDITAKEEEKEEK